MSPEYENPFSKIEEDGLGEHDGLTDEVRHFIHSLGATYIVFDLFNDDVPKRVGLVLDFHDKISAFRQAGDHLEFLFRPFTRDEEGEISYSGEVFWVKVERTDKPVPSGDPVAAGDPCCQWAWDPVRKVKYCVAMC